MNQFNCIDVVNSTGGRLIGENIAFNHVCIDSREAIPGSMFVAICGEKVDGHDFIKQALENGASCALVSKDISSYCSKVGINIPFILVEDTVLSLGKFAKWHREKFTPKTVAITGSMGKTTTRHMLVNILSEVSKTLSPEKNYNTDITVPLVLLNLDNSHKFAVIEMGACKPGDIKYLMGLINPDISLVTNIGPSHLSSFKTLDVTANTKGEAYSCLQDNGIAIVNVDDAYAPCLLAKLKEQKVITCSIHSNSDICAKDIKINSDSIDFNLVVETKDSVKKEIKINLPTLGVHDVINAIAAAACAVSLGVDLKTIKQGLEKFSAVYRRLEVFAGLNGAKIIDDSYNANPVSVKSALITLKNDGNKNKVFVFGDMGELGEQEVELHQEIGEFARDCGINTFFATGKLAEYASNSFDKNNNNSKFYAKKSDLVLDLKKILTENTTVLVKGSNNQRMDEVVKQLIAS